MREARSAAAMCGPPPYPPPPTAEDGGLQDTAEDGGLQDTAEDGGLHAGLGFMEPAVLAGFAGPPSAHATARAETLPSSSDRAHCPEGRQVVVHALPWLPTASHSGAGGGDSVRLRLVPCAVYNTNSYKR